MTTLGPGVRVKCVYSGEWYDPFGAVLAGPSIGSVWTIDERLERYEATLFSLVGWSNSEQFFHQECFVPLDGNEELSDLIAALKRGADQADIEHKEIVEIAKAIRTGAAEYVREAK